MQQSPTQDTGGAVGELRSDAQQLTSKAADRIQAEVDARKGSAAEQARSVSSAIETTAGQLDESAPSWLKSALQQGADQIQRFAETIDQKDSRQIFSAVQDFARERPALFLGTCAAAGFAAARLLKAGGQEQASQPVGETGHADEPWGGLDTAQQFSRQYGDPTSAGQTAPPSSPRGEFA